MCVRDDKWFGVNREFRGEYGGRGDLRCLGGGGMG